MIELLQSTDTVSTISLANAVIYAICAGALGLLISLTYMKTGKISKNFARTLIVLPILVCVVMLAVNGNFGTSLAVVGAFSLVRFRSLQGSSRDIAFIFFTMTVGIVCAIGQLGLAAIITALVCAIQFLLAKTGYAQSKVTAKNLKITISENLDYTSIFDDIFEEFTTKCEQVSVKTTNMGSMYEIQYLVTLNADASEKEFIDSIRVRNGNLNVVLGKLNYNEAEEL